jgi:uncharacterized protein YaaN involved in tellurite resistance
MQEQLKKALEFSNYKQTLAIQRKILKEKIEAKLTYGFNGGIFKINRELLNFVQLILNDGRVSGVILLDTNENPILVDDLENFKTEIFDRYFTATNEYFEQYQNLKKSRSVEKLLDL